MHQFGTIRHISSVLSQIRESDPHFISWDAKNLDEHMLKAGGSSHNQRWAKRERGKLSVMTRRGRMTASNLDTTCRRKDANII
jgi:hypothetical protein